MLLAAVLKTKAETLKCFKEYLEKDNKNDKVK
jgi:hypothetical protein